MAWRRGTGRSRIRDERAFTLPELLVATALSMVVIGAGVTVFTSSLASQARIQSQSDAIQQARTVMERMVRELRQGSSVPSASASQLSLITYIRDAACGATTPVCRVTYQCVTSGTCTRAVSQPDGGAPAAPAQVISGLSSPNVFAYTPPTSTTPATVTITLSLRAKDGGNAITLTDSATLRNPAAS